MKFGWADKCTEQSEKNVSDAQRVGDHNFIRPQFCAYATINKLLLAITDGTSQVTLYICASLVIVSWWTANSKIF